MQKDSINEEKPSKSVDIWLRVSTEDQAKGESPEQKLNNEDILTNVNFSYETTQDKSAKFN